MPAYTYWPWSVGFWQTSGPPNPTSSMQLSLAAPPAQSHGSSTLNVWFKFLMAASRIKVQDTATEMRTTQKYKKYKEYKECSNEKLVKCIKENESRTEVPDTPSELRTTHKHKKYKKYKKYNNKQIHKCPKKNESRTKVPGSAAESRKHLFVSLREHHYCPQL